MPHKPGFNDVTLRNVECLRETESAMLIRTEKGEDVWIPKSQIVEENSNVFCKGDYGRLVITKWIAKAKELV